MSKLSWKKKIIACMMEKDTYEDSFVPVIETLAEILERRTRLLKQFEDEGSQYVITKVSDRGAKNTAKNPLLGIIQECERDSLSYWTALGLTPLSMKRILKDQPEEKEEVKVSPLVKALMNVQKS